MAGISGRQFRPDFDRSRDFVATKKFKFNGEAIVPGQPINKVDYTVRLLQQLYDARYIGYAASGAYQRGTVLPDRPRHPKYVPPVERAASPVRSTRLRASVEDLEV